MIPRPLSEAAERNNPGRWICNTRPERCDGVFWVYGQAMECPLREKCRQGTRNSYQWTLGRKELGRFAELDVDALWRERHHSRLVQLQRAFNPEKFKTKRTPEQRKRATEWIRERRRKERETAPPAPVAPIKRVLLPCGEDCENCPYPACAYTEEELEAAETNCYDPAARRKKYLRDKQARAEDPALAAKFRRQNADRCRRWYQKNRAKNPKIKQGGEKNEQG